MMLPRFVDVKRDVWESTAAVGRWEGVGRKWVLGVCESFEAM